MKLKHPICYDPLCEVHNMNVKTLFPRGSQSFYEVNPDRPLPHPEPQHHKAPALDGAVQGKAKGVHRAVVVFTGYRVRPLDPDNFAGGCKDLLDGLRHAGLISGDEPWKIDFHTRQEKVGTYAQEKTIIEVDL